ncbi:hypothetical protein HZS_7109 [Henneguya salminicola]|nr:hypothetical protein HZS_7109 [Henneguya salminicola]
MGSVPGIFQQSPDGSLRLISISTESTRVPAPMPHNDHAYLPTSAYGPPDNSISSLNSLYNNGINEIPFTSLNLSQPNSQGYTQLQTVPPLQPRFQPNFSVASPMQTVNFRPSSAIRRSPVEIKHGNVVLRERMIPGMRENQTNNDNDAAFNNFFQHVYDVFQGSNFKVSESEILSTSISQWSIMSQEQRDKYLTSFRRSSMENTEPTTKIALDTHLNVAAVEQTTHDTNHISNQFYGERTKRRKCFRIGCQQMVENSIQLGGYYCDEKCAVIQAKYIFQRAYPHLKRIQG